ncbi:MAG: tRNA 2-thiocytidine biosynthesis TtcA family protein [Spirochaetales bacterium]|nr:tRNA 2-thiocytidine biosynthesis TtcA family protein [Spirochaetales bacterium]
MKELSEIFNGNIPPWVMRFVKQTGKGINRFNMIKENEKVLLGISGGKDSLALAFSLALRRRWLPINYDLTAVHINWEEYPIEEENIDKLRLFFDILDVPFESKTVKMFPGSYKDNFNCYLCSRNRKKVLFDIADKKDFTKIALGHHLDDLVETTLINLCFRGRFTTMLPVQEFFDGKLHIIRPMCEVKESAVTRLSNNLNFPVCKSPCPYDQTNIRSKIKPIVNNLSHIDKLTREHIYNAFWKEKDDFNFF